MIQEAITTLEASRASASDAAVKAATGILMALGEPAGILPALSTAFVEEARRRRRLHAFHYPHDNAADQNDTSHDRDRVPMEYDVHQKQQAEANKERCGEEAYTKKGSRGDWLFHACPASTTEHPLLEVFMKEPILWADQVVNVRSTA